MRFWYLTLMQKKPARIQEFFSGGWGPGLTPENSLDNIFFSPQLNLQFTEGVKCFFLQRKLYFSKDP